MLMNKKGWKLEQIINNSIKIINKNDQGFFIKSPIPNKSLNINGTYKFIFSAKALCDFIGIFKNKFVIIECKEITGNKFYKERIKPHQKEQLKKIKFFGGISLILFFIKDLNKIFATTLEDYLIMEKETIIKTIKIDMIINHSSELNFNDSTLEVNLFEYLDYSIEI